VTAAAATTVGAPKTVSVFEGQRCIGLILRKPTGVEGFSAKNESLGLFATEDAAAAAIWRRAHGQPAAQVVPVGTDLNGGDAA
jgi:hypothetical protein